MINPAVSVIIPVYNTEKYLHVCIDNIITQTFADLEIICIDDGSTDASGKILDAYAENDERVIVIHQENMGQSAARNVGIDRARGKYLYFMDSDDILDKEALTLFYEQAEREDLDLLSFNGYSIFDGISAEEVSPYFLTAYQRKHTYEGVKTGRDLFLDMRQNNEFFVTVWLLFIKRTFLNESNIRFIEGITHEDEAFSFDVFMNAERALHLNKTFYQRRIRPDSQMTSAHSFRDSYGYYICFLHVIDSMKKLENSHSEWDSSVVFERIQLILQNARSYYRGLSEEEKEKKNSLGNEMHLFQGLISDYSGKLDENNTLNKRLNEMSGKVHDLNQMNDRLKAEAAQLDLLIQKNEEQFNEQFKEQEKEYKSAMEDLSVRLERTEKEWKNCEELLCKTEKKLEEKTNELVNVRNSHSFKLGYALTTLPRNIRKSLRKT